MTELVFIEGVSGVGKLTIANLIKANTINGGDVMLVRYYNKDIPLFEEPLLSEFVRREFCYKPSHLVPLDEYTCVYKNVWHRFALDIDETYDYIIFDGSLIHHPINDMMRNYHIDGVQAASHVMAFLNFLEKRKKLAFSARQVIVNPSANTFIS